MATGQKPRRVDPRAVRIGEHLRSLRERQRLSQEVVAQHLGLTTGAYQHYESGRSLPGMADVPRLGAALGVPPCDLFPLDVIPPEVRPMSVTEPRPAPDYGDDIYRRTMDKLGRSNADILLRFLDFLETEDGHGREE